MIKLDFRTLGQTSLRLFAYWAIMVAIVVLANYPGVVCVTPLAWLLALRAGLETVSKSTSETTTARLAEAALSGALLGLLQGLLFWLVIAMAPVQTDERFSAALLTLLMVVLGIFTGALLAWFTGLQAEARREGD